MGGPTAAHYQHQQQSHSFYRSYNSASMGGGRTSTGGSGSSDPNGSALLARCPLHVESAYAAVTQVGTSWQLDIAVWRQLSLWQPPAWQGCGCWAQFSLVV